MRVNLEKIAEELAACRINERNAEDRSANLQSQLMLCQEELHIARQEASTIKQLLSESSENESKNRQLLENRINTLSMDFECASASYRQEINSLRLSLTHVQSERDRLVVLLSESEKANTTLVHASAIVDSDSYQSTEDSELETLRIEKTHYLSKISQDACDVERRVREAVAISTAALQAEIYVERGLRSTSERLIEDLQKRIMTLETERDSLSFLHKYADSDRLIMDHLKKILEERGGGRNSVYHNCAIVTHSYLNAGTTNDSFLRDNLDWMKKASNWFVFFFSFSSFYIYKLFFLMLSHAFILFSSPTLFIKQTNKKKGPSFQPLHLLVLFMLVILLKPCPFFNPISLLHRMI